MSFASVPHARVTNQRPNEDAISGSCCQSGEAVLVLPTHTASNPCGGKVFTVDAHFSIFQSNCVNDVLPGCVVQDTTTMIIMENDDIEDEDDAQAAYEKDSNKFIITATEVSS